MKVRIVPVIVFFCAAAFVSCKDKNAFILSGEVENPQNIKKVYLLETDSTQISIIDSAALSDQNKFSFKHQAPYSTLYKLKVGNALFDLIAQNGDDITFKTNALDTTNTYQITGSASSGKIKEFNKVSNHYTKITDQILSVYNYKTKKLNMPADPLFAVAVEEFKKNQKDYSEAALKFMNENKSSLAGFYASSSLDPVAYEKQLIDYADDIKGEFPGNVSVDQFIKRMESVKPISIGHTAPDFRLMDANYQPVKVSDYRGKYLMLDFWASWCAPCRKENPNVVKMYAKFKDKGLNILGISLDENRVDWQKAITADNLTWRQVSEFKNFNSPVVKLYKVEAIPSNFIIDPDGTIIAKNITGSDLEDFLNKTFSKSK
jgi:peroxiredoxin